MDEKHVGPNINTIINIITKQRVVRVGLYLSGKAVALCLQHPRFKSCCGQCVGTPTQIGTQRQTKFSHFFLLCGALILSPFGGNVGVT